MAALSEVLLPASGCGASSSLELRIALLPRDLAAESPAPLIQVAPGAETERLSDTQLLEGQEYLYEWIGVPPGVVPLQVEPQEIFQPDAEDGLRGRLRPGLATGLIDVRVSSRKLELGALSIEVRSRKLDYLTQYRWMLRDIANVFAELLMERFAASTMRFAPSPAGDPVTLYQRFAFLRELLTSAEFEGAMAQVVGRPHIAWESIDEPSRAGAPLRGSAHTVRQIARAGQRRLWVGGVVESLPVRMDRRRTEPEHDTEANQFVAFALMHWRQSTTELRDALSNCEDSAAVRRGVKESQELVDHLDEWLCQPIFRDLSLLARFPSENQVLLRREGYRDVFRAYLEYELGAQLAWRGAEAAFSAGQRDVATLYEYWVFLQLAQVLGSLLGREFDLSGLIRVTKNGLDLVLAAGAESSLVGEVARYGRRLRVELSFNRTYRRAGAGGGSWTRAMRPDASLQISPAATEQAWFEPVILHFDAKYRVDTAEDVFGSPDEILQLGEHGSGESGGARLRPKRSDLLKMHAYRDAIRRSAGAYVVYPGSVRGGRLHFSEFHELLPDLGAFSLKPTVDGQPDGEGELRNFLNEVIGHVARRLTEHERGRYWIRDSFSAPDYADHRPASLWPETLDPSTQILLGFVKSSAHWQWVIQGRTYNVRAGARSGAVASGAEMLYSQLLLLYCPDADIVEAFRITSAPELVLHEAMLATKYPDPKGDYWCFQIAKIAWPERYSACRARTIAQRAERESGVYGAPVALSWERLKKVINPVIG